MKWTTLLAAAACLAATLAGCENDAPDLIRKGISSYEQGHLDKAGKSLNEALNADPGDPDALFYLGRTYQAKGFYEQAIYYYQVCLEADPAYPRANEFLRECQRAIGPAGKDLQIIPDLEED